VKSVLAIRHVHFEDLGAFAGAFRDAGYAIEYRDSGVDDIAGIDPLAADVLAVLGAPIGAYEEDKYPVLLDELDLLERRLSAKQPTLGICLGAQLMARALGASVYPGEGKEIGWSRLSLTQDGRRGTLKHFDDVPVLHWHGDTFDLPNGAVRLASTPITENQAFSFGASALGIQFHPEIEEGGFERWLIGHALEIASVPNLSVADLRRDTRRWAPQTALRGRRLLNDWLADLLKLD
jgi:GMP synthase (glutamine-hydrolysing)